MVRWGEDRLGTFHLSIGLRSPTFFNIPVLADVSTLQSIEASMGGRVYSR